MKNLACFQTWIKKLKNKRKIPKNISRCIESNGVKIFSNISSFSIFSFLVTAQKNTK
jgi:hypothetical protein